MDLMETIVASVKKRDHKVVRVALGEEVNMKVHDMTLTRRQIMVGAAATVAAAALPAVKAAPAQKHIAYFMNGTTPTFSTRPAKRSWNAC
jgi:hypothetical protein